MNYPIYFYSQSLINIGFPLGFGILIFLTIFICFFTEDARILFKYCPFLLYLLATIAVISLITANTNRCIKKHNCISEQKYYYHAITIYKKGTIATATEIKEYNTALSKLIVFQTEHPECLSGYYDWISQPYITLKKE